MTASLSKVSIICPARDEADALPRLHEALFQALRALEGQHQFEIIYVDDGSRDGTQGKMQAIADLDPRVRVLSLARPFGKESALIAGLEHATGELVITLDADLQHPPELIPQLLEHARQGTDVVVAVQTQRPLAGWPRRIGRRLLSWCCERVPPAEATDFLVLSRRAVDTLLTIPEHHRSLLGLVYWLELPRVEMPFEPGPRTLGASKTTAAGRLARGVEHLFAYSRAPLRLATVLGGLVLAIGLLLMIWFPLQGLLRPGTVWFSWCYLIVLIHLVGGGILLSIGVLGEYLVRVLEQVKQRPLYVLKHDSKANTSKVLPFAPPRQDAA
jgi:glycosyltransferase involved in cell wall biosynthesis